MSKYDRLKIIIKQIEDSNYLHRPTEWYDVLSRNGSASTECRQACEISPAPALPSGVPPSAAVWWPGLVPGCLILRDDHDHNICDAAGRS